MTDKIIINGVDVSGCHNVGTNGLTNHKIPYCREFTGNCKAYPHCYFKQSARKDEKIRELENKFNCYACGNCKGKEDYRNLEIHHKGLRKQFDKQNDKLSKIAELCNKYENELYHPRNNISDELSAQIKQIALGE